MKDILTARIMRKLALSLPLLFPFYYYPRSNLQQHVYLTFDDGPDPVVTSRILALLQQKNIKATFFVGGNALIYLDVCKEIVAEGHALGGHTRTHPYLPKLNKKSFLSETVEFNDRLSNLLGVEISLFRPPYGFINPYQIYLINKKGLRIVLWTLDTLDCFPEPSLEEKVRKCGKQLRAHDIILIHDTIKNNIEYTQHLIDYILNMKFTFGKIS